MTRREPPEFVPPRVRIRAGLPKVGQYPATKLAALTRACAAEFVTQSLPPRQAFLLAAVPPQQSNTLQKQASGLSVCEANSVLGIRMCAIKRLLERRGLL